MGHIKGRQGRCVQNFMSNAGDSKLSGHKALHYVKGQGGRKALTGGRESPCNVKGQGGLRP